MASYYSGATLSREQVAQVAYQAGFRGDVLAKMVAISHDREAKYRGGASAGVHRTSTNNPNAQSGDVGLWQINWAAWGRELINAGVIRQFSDLKDPVTNGRAAKFVYDRQGFGAWAMGPHGFQAGGDPFRGVNVPAAQQAVQRAASQGMLGQDWNSNSGSGSATGAAAGPTSLPRDTKLIQATDSGNLWAWFRVPDIDGLWVRYAVPRDGSVNFAGHQIERLSNAQVAAKYGTSVNGGNAAELAEIPTAFGTYGTYLKTILDQLFTPGDPRRRDAEIMRIVAERAGRPDMSEAEFQNKVKATKYYQGRTEGQLRWNDLSEAERQTRRRETAVRMAQIWQQHMGSPIAIGELLGPRSEWVEAVASGKNGWGWFTEQVVKPRAEMHAESPWSRQLRTEREEQRQRPIDIENTVNQLRQTVDRWGVTLDEKTLATYGRALVEKRMSDDDVNNIIRQQAKVLYPWKDENLETIVAAAPWIEVYSRTMERQGSLQTPEIRRALTAMGRDPQNNDPWSFEQQLKLTPAWGETKNGQDAMFSAAADLGQLVGFE